MQIIGMMQKEAILLFINKLFLYYIYIQHLRDKMHVKRFMDKYQTPQKS